VGTPNNKHEPGPNYKRVQGGGELSIRKFRAGPGVKFAYFLFCELNGQMIVVRQTVRVNAYADAGGN
jgi:hypothetical protein